jgi:hypothetical protein
LFVYGWIIGKDSIKVLSDCPADVAGCVDCPAKYNPSFASFLKAFVAVHSVNESVTQRTLDGFEVRVE